MNAISADEISRVCGQVHPDCNIHNTTIAYVQFLLHPYVETIEAATSTEGIVQWLPLVFPKETAKHALSELGKTRLRMLATLETDDDDTHGIITAVKNTVIEYIIAEILDRSGDLARTSNDRNILPWDVLNAIGNDGELAKIFNITPGETNLPITLTVKNKQFEHSMSIDVMMGILLFSDPEIGNNDFNMSMFGVKLTPGFQQFTTENDVGSFRYTFDEYDMFGAGIKSHDYSVNINNKIYGFDNPEFMQGFATGAEWIGVIHQNYWSNLQLNKFDKISQTSTSTSITF